MQNGVFLAHIAIAGRAILQIVSVAVLFKVVPFNGHLRALHGMVVFGLQVVTVVGVVYLLNVA